MMIKKNDKEEKKNDNKNSSKIDDKNDNENDDKKNNKKDDANIIVKTIPTITIITYVLTGNSFHSISS